MNTLFLELLTVLIRSLRGTLTAAVVLLALPALAQKATVRDGVILRDGEPYARVQSSGSVFSHRDFSFKTLDGKEFMMMYFDDATDDYRVVFLPGEEQARLPARYGSAAVMAQEVVDNNLVEGGAFNPAGLKRFRLAHPASGAPPAVAGAKTTSSAKRTTSSTKSSANTKTQSSTGKSVSDADDDIEKAADEVSDAILDIGASIERAFEKDSVRRAERRTQQAKQGGNAGAARDRSVPVTVRQRELRQGSAIIGTFDVKTTAQPGFVERSYTFYSPGGDVVAEATLPDNAPKSAELVTTKDNRLVTVPLTTWTQWDVAAELAEWLAKRRYL